MGLFGRGKGGGLMNAIRCDEQEYLVWKWRPLGQAVNSTSRENAIRWGSSLRVKDGEVAVFVYHQKNGTMEDFIVGPFDQIIKTANFPVLASIVGLAYGGETPFQADVYFINTAAVIQIPFTIPYFDVQDPRFPDLQVPVAVGGKITFRITDARDFVKVNRLINFTLEDFKAQVKDTVVNRVKGTITNVLYQVQMPLVQIERNIEFVSEFIGKKLAEDFKDFGVTLRRCDISRIDPDKDSVNWHKLMKVTGDYAIRSTELNQDIAYDTAKTQSELNLKNMTEAQRINAENMAETLRIQREEMQFAQRAQTEQAAYAQKLQSEQANLGAFTVDRQADVLGVAADNLGQMGTVNLGGGNVGGGMNPAGLMTGMALGGAMGQQMSQMMSQMGGQMQGFQQQNQGGVATPPPMPGAVPPPIPGTPSGLSNSPIYMVAVNGQQAGPFSIAQLQQLRNSGQIDEQTLIWKQGMPQWSPAIQLSELQVIFMPPAATGGGVPPIPPVPPINP